MRFDGARRRPCVSPLAGIVTVSVLLNPETFPALSRARTVRLYVAPGVRWRRRVEIELALAMNPRSTSKMS